MKKLLVIRCMTKWSGTELTGQGIKYNCGSFVLSHNLPPLTLFLQEIFRLV